MKRGLNIDAPFLGDEPETRNGLVRVRNATLVPVSSQTAGGAAMMEPMAEQSPRASGQMGRRPPTARSVMLLFALGSAAAIAVAVVGGYFALRSVAIDEAKRETRTRVQESGQLVEATSPTAC